MAKRILILSIVGMLFFAFFSSQTIFAQEATQDTETDNTKLTAGDPNQLFNDYDITDEEYLAIYFLKDRGVIEGYPDGELKPEININRAEFTKIILEAKQDIEIAYDPAFTFPDNPSDQWFAKYVSTAKKENIIEGYPDGYFRPEQNINYPEALKIVINTFDLSSPETSEFYDSYYLDDYSGEWYTPFLETASNTNIFSIDWDFEPAEFISRGESFDSLYRTMVIQETPYDIFYYPIIFLGEQDGIVYSYPSNEFKLPLVYTNIDPTVDVQLYKADVDTLLDSRIECNCYRYSANYQIKQEFIDRMDLISDSQVEIETVERDEPTFEPYFIEEEIVEQDGFLPLSNITEKGIYFINVENDLLPPQHLFVVVSDNNMIYHGSEDNDLLWLVNHQTEEKVSSADVDFYELDFNADMSANVNSLASDRTDSSGVILDTPQNSNYIVAEKDGDTTLLSKYHSDYRSTSTFKDYNYYAYTDRPVYRPGDQVNFKLIAREYKDGEYKLLSNSDTIDVKIYNYVNYSENVVYEETLRPSDFSTVTGAFDLSSESSTGDYYFDVSINDEEVYAYYNFSVESYKKDEYALSITTDQDSYINGDTAEITITGEYFFGQPVTNQEITYTVLRSSSYYTTYEYDSIGKGYYGYGEEILTGKGELNSSGQYSFNLDIENETYDDEYYSYSGLMNAQFEIRVETIDASNIPVEKSYYFNSYATEFDLFIDQLTPIPEAGEEVEVLVSAVDHDDDPYKGAELDIKVFEQTYKKTDEVIVYDHWTDSYIPEPIWEYEENEIYSVSNVTTDSNGEYSLEFTPEKPASIKIEISATDDRNNTIVTNFYLTVYGEDDEYSYTSYYRYDSILISADKDEYSVGDTATFLIKTPKDSGEALFMTFKNGIEEYEIIELDGEDTEIEMKITEDHLPNFAIGVDTLYNKQFISNDMIVEVDPGDMELNIDIDPETDTALPGEEVEYEITVTDSDGDPVKTDLSFALVDKAIFEIEDQDLTDVVDKFYYTRYFYLSQYTNTIITQFEKDAPDYYSEPLALEEDMATAGDLGGAFGLGGGAEGEGGGGGLRDELSSATRSVFLDTAHWVANVTTNSSGKATVDIELPDNLTTWQSTVLGNTKDTKVGVGTEDIVVQKDIVISPYTPRFVTLEDEFTLRAVVRNYDANSNMEAILGGSGFELLNTEGNNDEYSLTIDEGDSEEVEWDIRVTAEDELNLTFTAQEASGSKIDEVELTLPVNLYGEEKLTSYTGEDSAEVTITPETGDLDNIKELSVILSPTLAENITTSLEALTGYPYGCVEQTMSRFIPDIVAYANRDKVDFNDDIFDDIDEMINDGLTRLYEFQHDDGGWGWWKDDDSTPKNTAYVMYGLILAKNNGFTVNEDIYNSGLGALEVFNLSSEYSSYQPYMMYVLTLAGETTVDELNGVASNPDLRAIDHAYLALSYQKLGALTDAQTELAKIKTVIIEEPKYAYIDESVIDYETMSSDELATAVALEAFAEIEPENELTVKMIRWLDSKKQGGFYHETHSTAQAVIAFVRYLVNTNRDNPNMTYKIKLGGATVYEGALTENTEFELDPADLSANNPKVEIEKSGTGTLYYNVVQSEFFGEKNIAAYDEGLTVTRTYMNENGVPLSGYISAGDVIKVSIKIDAPSDYNYLIIKDNLPAGFEPIETDDDWFWYDYGIEGGYDDWVDNKDLYDDHAALFVTYLWSGEHNYSYTARAVTPGEFQADPTSAYLMYMPEISGGSESETIEIR